MKQIILTALLSIGIQNNIVLASNLEQLDLPCKSAVEGVNFEVSAKLLIDSTDPLYTVRRCALFLKSTPTSKPQQISMVLIDQNYQTTTFVGNGPAREIILTYTKKTKSAEVSRNGNVEFICQ